MALPEPSPPPAPTDEPLLDEEQLDGDLHGGHPPAQVLAPPLRPAPPMDLGDTGLDDDEEDVEAPALPPRRGPAPAAEGGESLLDESLLGDSPLGGSLFDDGVLRLDDEDDLDIPLAPEARPAGKALAGVEELAELVDLGGMRIPATLATAIGESVLSAPLRLLSEGRVRVQLGSQVLEGDPRGTLVRFRLGPHRVEAPLRLVEGASPRLVLGGDVLAGRFVVDPGLRHVLTEARRPEDDHSEDAE